MPSKDRRQQIMRAAEQLFSNRRFHEITTDDIAARAGVGKGTIYRYFKNKDELFHETALHGFEELCALLNAEDCRTAPLADRLLHACRHIDSFFRRRRRWFGLMQAEENRLAQNRGRLRSQWRERRQRLTGILTAILTDAAAHGELRGDIEPQRLAALLLGMLKSIARDPDRCGSDDGAVVALVELFLHGALRTPVPERIP